MSDKNKKLLKEYGWSATITFVTAFAVAIAPMAGDVELTRAAIFALLASGLRAGFSALINLIATAGRSISSTSVTS